MKHLTISGLVLSLFMVSALSGCAMFGGGEPSPPGVALAERYGLDAWDEVERIEFTFAVDRGEERGTRRTWSWDVAGNTFTARPGQDDARTVSLDDVPEDAQREHRGFINDSYWLLFPYYIVWSDNEVIDHGVTTMPGGDDPAHKLTVLYPAEGGYTPGDAYDLYVNPDSGLIEAWVFRRGNGDGGGAVSWENEVTFNGVTFATDHHGTPRGGFRLFFPYVKLWFKDGVVHEFEMPDLR